MQPPPSSAKHLPRLDSLRGIGALMVAGYHSLSAGHGPIMGPVMWVSGFLFDGRIGVVIFFVLSGLVLGYSLRRTGEPSPRHYGQFCLRRLFRIYPAYCVSTFCFLLYYLILLRHPGTERGFLNAYGTNFLSKTEVVENFFFCHQGLNAVTWTLKVEMFAAVLLPFMHYFSLSTGNLGRMLLLGMLGVVAACSGEQHTRMCLYLFYLGYLLSPLIQNPGVEDVSKKKWTLWALLGLALVAFGLGHLFPNGEGDMRGTILGAAVGSVITLFLLIRAPDLVIFRFLDLHWLRYLGKISYSFYLFDLLCIDFVQRFGPWRGAATHAGTSIAVLLSSSLLCAALASLSYLVVERPFIKWGSSLSGFLGLQPK